MSLIILIIYFFSLSCILIFSLFQLQLAFIYLWSKKQEKSCAEKPEKKGDVPFVTIQLPIYNELYVVERLLDNIARIIYPRDKLEIQVLDDSTDETTEILKRKVDELKCQNINILYIHRTERTGAKAGALKNGLATSKGEFIALFDADFLPDPDFLQKTIPCFDNDRIGAVQTRWGHLNRNYSLFTRLQAFALDVHFTIEQGGRNRKGYFINFNGTAGIWRKTAIYDAGNWQGDTLTEDFDLSYRAQLKGWKLIYLEEVVTPAELPVALSAIKAQQFRWMKGGAQNFLKNHRKVLSASISFMTKINAIFHLLNSSVFLFTFLIVMLSFPVLLIQKNHTEYNALFSASSVFVLTTFILLLYYGVAFFKVSRQKGSWLLYPIYYILFLIFMLGLSLSNVIAVTEAFLGIKSSFLRTPKFNIRLKKDSWKQNKYLAGGVSYISIFEGLLSLFFLGCIVSSIYMKQYGFLYFHAMLFLGFGFISLYSFKKIVS